MRDKIGEQRFQALRVVLPGFPITTSFNSIKEVKKYLSAERTVCLLCGREFKHIAVHIKKIHKITSDEYKKRYKIPWTYGLISPESSKKYSKVKEKPQAKKHWNLISKKGWLIRQKTIHTQRKCPFVKEIAAESYKLLEIGRSKQAWMGV